MDQRIHRKTSLTGRILQVKQLLASTFVYRFQLLPTPHKSFLDNVDKEIHDYVWENKQHRLRKSVLFQPTYEGGLGMVNVYVQEQSLKFAWFNRMLSDTANVQFWSIHLTHCFVIPLCDVLICNLHPSRLSAVQRFATILHHFWVDVFTAWFKHFFIPLGSESEETKTRVLALPVLFNSEIILARVWDSPLLHETLKEHDVLLLKPFLVNFVTIFSTINAVDPPWQHRLHVLEP